MFTPSLTRTLDTVFIITLSIWSLNVEQWTSTIHYPRMCKVSTFYLSFQTKQFKLVSEFSVYFAPQQVIHLIKWL